MKMSNQIPVGEHQNKKAPARSTGLMTCLTAAAATVLMALMGTGCQSAIDTNNLGTNPAMMAHGDEANMDFWYALATDRICSNDEAFHGLLIYLEQDNKASTYDERVTYLKSLGMLPDGFKGKPEEAITRGTLAVALIKVLEIKGGIFLHLFNKSERYATRELVYEGIYPESTPNQIFSGSEFVGIIGQVEDYQRSNPPTVSPAQQMAAPSTPPPLLARPVEPHDSAAAATSPATSAPAQP